MSARKKTARKKSTQRKTRPKGLLHAADRELAQLSKRLDKKIAGLGREIQKAEREAGREAAKLLRGKHKAQFTPFLDCGDHVIIVNAEKAKVTGNKANDKMYYRHSGYPGGIRARSFEQMIEKQPERVIELAVKGMLPRNPLGRAMYRKLKVYAGPNHPHQAQQPKALEI